MSIYDRTFTCEDCGQLARRIRHAGEPRICAACGIARGMEAALQMAAKSGPVYDRWRQTKGPGGRPKSKGQ